MTESAAVREFAEALPDYGQKGNVLAELSESLERLKTGSLRVDEAIALSPESSARRENVIGTDDRVMISNTTVSPYRSICHLLIRFPSGQFLGTGAYVDQGTILTAGHNVFDPETGQWAIQIAVTPGKNGSQNPAGGPIVAPRSALRTTAGWKRGSQVADVGGICFGRSVSPHYLGICSFGPDEEDALRGLTVNVVGYPGQTNHPDPGRPNTMWGHVRRVARFERHRLFYDVDTTGGQSGSPVLHADEGGGIYCVGVHNYGSAPYNIATRISDPLFEIIESWIEGK